MGVLALELKPPVALLLPVAATGVVGGADPVRLLETDPDPDAAPDPDAFPAP